jgi:hypothetical protein
MNIIQENVKWFSVKVSKDIRDTEKTLDTAKYLEEEEIERLVESAPSIQKKSIHWNHV